MTISSNDHGTMRGYRQGCKNECCLRARRRDAAERELRNAVAPVMRPAGPSRRRIDALVKQGYTLKRIAEGAGIAQRSARQIRNGKVQRVHASTERNLQGLPYGDVKPTYIPARGHLLRLQALRADGWTTEALRDAGYSHGMFGFERVRIPTTKNVIEACIKLGAGTSDIARARAADRGWRGRAELDQDCLLDPYWDGYGGLLNATPEEVAEEIALMQKAGLTRREARLRWGLAG